MSRLVTIFGVYPQASSNGDYPITPLINRELDNSGFRLFLRCLERKGVDVGRHKLERLSAYASFYDPAYPFMYLSQPVRRVSRISDLLKMAQDAGSIMEDLSR